jgi:hypothetical protein
MDLLSRLLLKVPNQIQAKKMNKTPIIEPTVMSIKKCCERYTREYETTTAMTNKNNFNPLFFVSNAIVKNKLNAVVV